MLTHKQKRIISTEFVEAQYMNALHDFAQDWKPKQVKIIHKIEDILKVAALVACTSVIGIMLFQSW
jgi:hypothetical protein